MIAITNSTVVSDASKYGWFVSDQVSQIAAAPILAKVGQQTPDFFCNYQKDLVTGAFDTSCYTKAQGVEYVRDSFLNKNVKCISVQLQEGKLYHDLELAPLIEKVMQTEPSRKLLNQALSKGSIAFLSGDHQSAPGGGSWRPLEREVRVRSDEMPNRKLGHLLFEIADALQLEKQLALSKDTNEGTVSKESYVKRWEEIQFQTGKIFNSVVQECISKHHWPKQADLDMSMLFRPSLKWDDFWKMIQHSSHADYFRSDWDHVARDSYCEKNPGKPDCN